MKKGLKRTIIYGAIVGGVFAISLVCYGVSRGYKSTYTKNDVAKSGCETKIAQAQSKIDAEMAKPEAERDQTVINRQNDIIAAQEALIPTYVEKMDAASAVYQPLAITSYISSIGGLAAFGVCLAVSDHLKAKEEEAAGRN